MTLRNVAVKKTEALMKSDIDFNELGLTENQAIEISNLQKILGKSSTILIEIEKKLAQEKEKIRKQEIQAGIPELKAMRNLVKKKLTQAQNELHGATKVALANVPGEELEDKLRHIHEQKALNGRQ